MNIAYHDETNKQGLFSSLDIIDKTEATSLLGKSSHIFVAANVSNTKYAINPMKNLLDYVMASQFIYQYSKTNILHKFHEQVRCSSEHASNGGWRF